MSGHIPKKKAVIIGINYVETEGISLRGCANDAKLMALTLMSHFDFNASDIIFLTDCEPDRGYDTLVDSQEPVSFYDNWPRDEIPPTKHHDSRIYPNKRNILTAINWLTRDAEAGDILVFYFAGHGVQVDVLTSYEGEGYDEALLPADSTLYLASNGSDLDEYNVLLCSELKELLLCVPPETQLNVILDCNGGQTILDPAGNLNGMWYIKGIVTKGIWPFLSATNKVKRAQYNSSVFKEEQMVHRLVRPRYVPCVQVGNTQNLKDPSLQSTQYVSLSCKGYCFSAAPWSQIAAEASLPLLSVTRKTQVTDSSMSLSSSSVSVPSNSQSFNGTGLLSSTTESKLGVIEIPISRGGAYNIIHGVFTWSFCKAISDIATGILQQGRPRNELSYKTILARVREYISCLKTSILAHLDQNPELTIHSGGAGTVSEYFCSPFGGDKSIDFDFDHYFRMTDNCIRHLRKNQNFLIPQEAYNSMLQANKNDNLVFHSVNLSVLSKPIHSSENQVSQEDSPPTFRENNDQEDENKKHEVNHLENRKTVDASKNVNQVLGSGLSLPPTSAPSPAIGPVLGSRIGQFPPSNQIKTFDQGFIQNPSFNYNEDHSSHLAASSVNLVPPTASLFNPIFNNRNINEGFPNYNLSNFDSENNQFTDTNNLRISTNSNLNTQNKVMTGEHLQRNGEDKPVIGFNTFNPYSMFVGPESSNISNNKNKNYDLHNFKYPFEQRYELKPIHGVMLSNPIKSITPRNISQYNHQVTPNQRFIQSQSKLHNFHISTGINQFPMSTSSSSQAIATNTPPTPPISSYRSFDHPNYINQTSNLITYPPLTIMQSINQNLVAPVRSLPNSNNFYQQLPQTGHFTSSINSQYTNSEYCSDHKLVNFGVSEQLLQAPNGFNTVNPFPKSNQISNSQFYPTSFVSYPPKLPMNMFGANI
ncbi:ICE-like protease p20 domain-containing [Cryptosporidium sp. chipmunk genotype I]|uniref:ICE-like protease p20 domain-containing n=1 Tax=Cryptosporidium sp. chipmunk genotype I TaxID=1280935 RepID=UPI00351A1173|nr:ICE-like protease p20 domain-containing [Cryptosporidium sp. chipmunk genotype I]